MEKYQNKTEEVKSEELMVKFILGGMKREKYF